METNFDKKFDELLNYIRIDIPDEHESFKIAEGAMGVLKLMDECEIQYCNYPAQSPYSEKWIYAKYFMKWLSLNSHPNG